MRKTIAVLLAACLAGAVLVAPAAAKKKRKPAPPPAPVQADQTYYLVNPDPDEQCANGDNAFLRVAPGEGTFSHCVIGGTGVPNDLTNAVLGTPCPGAIVTYVSRCGSVTFHADQALPLVVDASRPLTGTIHVSSIDIGGGTPPLSAGPARLNGTLRGAVGEEPVDLGTFSAEYTVTPAQKTYEIEFEVDLADTLQRAQLTALSIELWNGGVAPAQVYETNLSTVSVPVWRTP